MSDILRVQVMVSGRVQGVGYRAWCAEAAQQRGLAGFVRNRRDGAVEALFDGPREAVEAMVAACWSGPISARVDDVRVQPASAVTGTDTPPGERFMVLATL